MIQGQFARFEEGILCQRFNVFPGLEAKITTGSDEKSGWFAGIAAIVRRLILDSKGYEGDSATTMLKATFNVRDINTEKAKHILGKSSSNKKWDIFNE